jgi:mRNA-degrading endonuclease RelE of RelBE toxin-antitoxin system
VKAPFVELPAFERLRAEYLSDEAYRELQLALMANPEAGDVIEGTGGLRKLRRPDPRRGKGKRGGLRVIYYFWTGGDQFWLFSVYDKDEAADLTPPQRKALKEFLKQEVERRQKAKGTTS